MITEEILIRSKKQRKHLDVIEQETNMAAASYVAGMALWNYIYPFSSHESREKYDSRRRQTMGHFVPYTRLIAARYLENIFGSEVVKRTTGDTYLDKYLEDYYADWFENELALPALYIPELFVYVTPKRVDENLKLELGRDLTAAEEDKYGIYPECHIVYPQHVVSLSESESSDLEWIRIRFEDCDLLIDAEEIARVENDKIISRITHNFGEIPAHRITYERNAFYENAIGLAPLSAIPNLSIALLQIIGMYIESIYTAMSYPLVTSPMTTDASDVENIGNETILIEDFQHKGITRYLAVPLEQINSLLTFVYEKGPKVIYEAARMIDRNVTVSAQQAASGLSKAFDFIPENNAVKKVSKWLRRIDDKLVRLIKAGWSGGAGAYTIVYPKSFGGKTHTEIIQEVTEVIDKLNSPNMPKSDTGIRLMILNAYLQFLPELSEEELGMITSEIENWKQENPQLTDVSNLLTKGVQNGNAKTENPAANSGDALLTKGASNQDKAGNGSRGKN